MANINLEDVLAGQHLSPFTLGEFEEHLVHVQRSAENLYFYFWLADYTKQYREWEAGLNERKDSRAPLPATLLKPITCLSNMRPARKGVFRFVPTFLRKMTKGQKDKVDDEPQVHQVQLSSISDQSCIVPMKATPPEDLKKAFESLQAFVIPPKTHQPFHEIPDGFELELNISQQLKDRFRFEAQTSIHPDIFLPIKKEVMNMLSDSMRIWLKDCSGNSDNHRAYMTLLIGATCVGLAIVGTVLLMIKTSSVKIRMSLSPLIWIGLEIFFCGVFRTCPLMFIFGTFRQIHVWELGRAKEAAALTEKKLLSKRHDFFMDIQAKQGTNTGALPLPSDPTSLSLPGDPTSLSRVVIPSQLTPSTLQSFWDSGSLKSPSDVISPISRPDDTRKPSPLAISIDCPVLPNDLDATTSSRLIIPCSPSPARQKTPEKKLSHSPSAPILGPLTKVLSPVAIRSHRISILKSVLLATVLTASWMLLCLLLPAPFRHSKTR